jgi:hypothetical protein
VIPLPEADVEPRRPAVPGCESSVELEFETPARWQRAMVRVGVREDEGVEPGAGSTESSCMSPDDATKRRRAYEGLRQAVVPRNETGFRPVDSNSRGDHAYRRSELDDEVARPVIGGLRTLALDPHRLKSSPSPTRTATTGVSITSEISCADRPDRDRLARAGKAGPASGNAPSGRLPRRDMAGRRRWPEAALRDATVDPHLTPGDTPSTLFCVCSKGRLTGAPGAALGWHRFQLWRERATDTQYIASTRRIALVPSDG